MALLQGLDEFRERLVVVDIQELTGRQGREALEELSSRLLLWWSCRMGKSISRVGKSQWMRGRKTGND